MSIFKDFNFSSQIACNLTPDDVIMTSCFEAHLWYKDYAYANFECCAMNINGKSLAQQKRVQSLWALVPKRRRPPPKKNPDEKKGFFAFAKKPIIKNLFRLFYILTLQNQNLKHIKIKQIVSSWCKTKVVFCIKIWSKHFDYIWHHMSGQKSGQLKFVRLFYFPFIWTIVT